MKKKNTKRELKFLLKKIDKRNFFQQEFFFSGNSFKEFFYLFIYFLKGLLLFFFFYGKFVFEDFFFTIKTSPLLKKAFPFKKQISTHEKNFLVKKKGGIK